MLLKNRKDKIKLRYIIIILVLKTAVMAADSITERIKIDDTLIVPGRGAEKVFLLEDINDVITRYGTSRFRYSKPEKLSELFKDIFKVDGKTRVYFDGIYYNQDKKIVLFLFQRKIVAIAGFNSGKKTEESVQLARGVDYFIFSYGNKSLTVVESTGNKICIYQDRGVAVIDDGGDDSIDMYIVFPASQKQQ